MKYYSYERMPANLHAVRNLFLDGPTDEWDEHSGRPLAQAFTSFYPRPRDYDMTRMADAHLRSLVLGAGLR